MTTTLQERLDEYKLLMEEIYTNYHYGRAFAQACLIAITTCKDTTSRNDYITSIGHHFNIPTDKVERVIALLPV